MVGGKPGSSGGSIAKELEKEAEMTAERVVEGEAMDSTDTNWRYMAYGARLRTILMAGHRYIAYTSDLAESFRPVAHPYMVRGGYAVSWMYLTGDCAYETYRAYQRNQAFLHQPPPDSVANTPESFKVKEDPNAKREVPLKEDYRLIGAKRAVFQTVASMLLPSLSIHTIVRYSGIAMKNVKNVRVRTWTPIGLGLAAVPPLPYIFDHPVEHAVDWIFDKGVDAYEKKPTKEKEL